MREVFNALRTAVVGWGMVCLGEVGARFPGDRLVDEADVKRKIQEVVLKAVKVLKGEEEPSPSIMDLIIFESLRHMAKESIHWAPHDYRYWEECGLFKKPYYTDDVKIPAYRRFAAKTLLALTAPMYRKRRS